MQNQSIAKFLNKKIKLHNKHKIQSNLFANLSQPHTPIKPSPPRLKPKIRLAPAPPSSSLLTQLAFQHRQHKHLSQSVLQSFVSSSSSLEQTYLNASF
jgi:hypothetical protein